MSTVKIKGNWNKQKGKLKIQLSNLNGSDDFYMVEEELQNLEIDKGKKAKKINFKKEMDW